MSQWSATDAMHMRRALVLAAQALGKTRPNPMVGCVIVAPSGEVIGEGYHHRAGEPHAEVMALRVALARGYTTEGATAFVTLEPCNHHGRTPPCTLALIDAKVARVVIATRDPNAHASGGAVTLRNAGIRVDEGCERLDANLLNAPFLTFHQLKRPLIRLKWAMTLDGATSTESGDSKWITSGVAREEVHRQRALHDAILVGAGTVIADNPSLTIRPPAQQHSPLLRVVLDRELRSPLESRIYTVSDQAPTLVFCSDKASPARIDSLREKGVAVDIAPSSDLDFIPHVLRQLTKRQVQSLYVEGGRTVAGAFIEAGVVDVIDSWIAPKILGAGAVNLSPINRAHSPLVMEHAQRLHHLKMEQYGDDYLLRGWLSKHLFEDIQGSQDALSQGS